MRQPNFIATFIAVAAGIAFTSARGIPAKIAAETGDATAFVMSVLLASILLWIPARLVVGLASTLIEKKNG